MVAAVSHSSQNESAQRHDTICIHSTDKAEMYRMSYIPLKIQIHLFLASVPDAADPGLTLSTYISQVKLNIFKSHVTQGGADTFKLRASSKCIPQIQLFPS